jgi:anthranilate synthase component 1
LESVTGGENVSRYSFLGVRPRAVLRVKNSQARREACGKVETWSLLPGEDPLDTLKREMYSEVPVPVPGLPTFVGGAVGLLSYDIVRYFERLPDGTVDDLNIDDLAMMMADTIVVFDHAKNLMRILSMTDGSASGYDRASAEIDAILRRLAQPLPPLPDGAFEPHEVTCNVTQERFEGMVTRMKEYLAQGDGLQMVPSQRFSTKIDAHPLTIYRALRTINPSPYMFLLRFGDFDLAGASPEILVGLHGRTARVRPIAGTRWRGKDEEEDRALEIELLADEKERAEHVMLVDLGRNDLGRVCDYGSVKVNELMVIERYSHVMHIVSDVTGTLAADKDAYDLFRATHPAGTVTGAPKVRAMQIIDELEQTRRGSYAGGVGFFSHTGDLDTCIALRTILIKDGVAHVQAGGGVVYDSDPTKEYEESRNKAKAALRSIEMAQRGL